MTATGSTPPRLRPRVEGDREGEILAATVVALAELGYDRLTMDAVATEAKASKATLYRRWSSKADLVVDAISRAKGCPCPAGVDTGSLRGDLLAISCGAGGLTDHLPMSVIAALLTAMHRDAELQRAFHERFLAPRLQLVATSLARAVGRAEIAADADLELLGRALPAIAMHRALLSGEPPDRAFVERVIDNVVLPAARGRIADGAARPTDSSDVRHTAPDLEEGTTNG